MLCKVKRIPLYKTQFFFINKAIFQRFYERNIPYFHPLIWDRVGDTDYFYKPLI